MEGTAHLRGARKWSLLIQSRFILFTSTPITLCMRCIPCTWVTVWFLEYCAEARSCDARTVFSQALILQEPGWSRVKDHRFSTYFARELSREHLHCSMSATGSDYSSLQRIGEEKLAERHARKRTPLCMDGPYYQANKRLLPFRTAVKISESQGQLMRVNVSHLGIAAWRTVCLVRVSIVRQPKIFSIEATSSAARDRIRLSTACTHQTNVYSKAPTQFCTHVTKANHVQKYGLSSDSECTKKVSRGKDICFDSIWG